MKRIFTLFLAWLGLFAGSVWAQDLPTPLADVTLERRASLPEAQLLETRLINLLHFQTVIASKAARMAPVAACNRL